MEEIKERGIVRKEPIELIGKQIYEGHWNQENQKHGTGVLISRDGSIREGLWLNDKAVGNGRMIH